MAEWKRLERLSNVKEPVKEPCRCILLEQSRWKTAKGDAGEGPIVEGDGIKLCCRTVPLEAGGKLPIQGVGWAHSQGWLLGDVREFTWPGAREGDESRLAPGSWLVSPGYGGPIRRDDRGGGWWRLGPGRWWFGETEILLQGYVRRSGMRMEPKRKH